MAFLQIEFSGSSIGKMACMNVLLPEGEGPYPVLYLLHGYSDNHTVWQRRTSIERYVAGEDLIVVMPDGHVSFYANDPRPGGRAYEDHIVRDVVEFTDRAFPTIAKREGRAIAGLSMGGYGAMMIGLKHHDRFAAISSHSGALGFVHDHYVRDDPGINSLAEALAAGGSYDCHELARQAVAAETCPAVRFDCGHDDFLIEYNRHFHEHLEAIGLAHTYEEFDGVHEWAYWDSHVPETIRFVLDNVERAAAREP